MKLYNLNMYEKAYSISLLLVKLYCMTLYLNWIMALYTKHFRKMLKHFKMGGAPLHNIEGMGAAFLHKVGGSTNTIAKGVQIAKRTM